MVPTAPSVAAPIDDQRAQAQRLESSLNDMGEKLAGLYEQIKYNEDELEQSKQAIADAEASIETAQQEVQRVTGLVRERAVALYHRSGRTGLSEFETNVDEIAARRKYAQVTGVRDNALLEQLAKAKADLAAKRDAAEQERNDAQSRADTLAQQQSQFEQAQAQQQALLNKVNGDIAVLVAQEQAKRAAAEAPKVAATSTETAASAATSQTTTSVAGTPVTTPPALTAPPAAPAPSGRGAIAVAFAEAQLDKPYCYGGTGPSCYDCSGLTMMAWAQAGVYLPRNSEAQFGAYPRVSMNALQPGDLVWNPGHIGIYVGNGAVIHAPHTGDVVRYIGVGYFQAAVRPG